MRLDLVFVFNNVINNIEDFAPYTLPFSRYDEVDVNVYFYFPDGREIY